MKKLLLTLMLFALVTAGFAQTTYYWASGSGAFTTLTGTNWSTTPGGTADVARSGTDDILVFDGVAISFEITGVTIGKLDLRNSADITIQRPQLPQVSGTTTLLLSGATGVGLAVDNSKLRIQGNGLTSAILAFASGITGKVSNNGEIYVTGTASNRITLPAITTLTFETGTKAYVNSAGNPFNNNTSSVDFGVKFKSGSSLIYQGGLSPQGNTSTGKILDFEKGSTFIMETSYSTSINLFASKTFANVIIRNNSTVTLNENFYGIDDLTIEAGSTFLTRNQGISPFRGNILNKGTFGAASGITSNQILMIGTTPQSITGTGTFSNIGGLAVATDANVTLGTSLNLVGTSTGSITGILNTATYSLTGSANFQFRGAVSTISNTAPLVTGNNVITFPTTTNYNDAGVSIGLKVVGTGIPNDTYIIATSSTNRQITLSNAPTQTVAAATLTISSTTPTLKTANANGADGAIQTLGTLSYGANTKFIFDAATSNPFPLNNPNDLGDLTFNAAATTNKDATITGALTLNASKLTIRTGDNLTMSAASSFTGASSSAYIITAANTSTGAVGILKLAGVAASKSVPVGSATNYLPVTVNPAGASDFSINVFQGATADATPNGAALSSKTDVVDAIYNINRTTGTGTCAVTLGWQTGLEGTNFAAFSDAQVGVSQYMGGAYNTFTGSGNNTSNVATITVSSFEPFLVGKLGTTLPVKLIAFTAKAVNQTAVLNWESTAESNLDKFNVQRSTDGVAFETIGSVKANNKDGVFNYSFVDKSPVFGANYYKLVSVDLDAKTAASNVQAVNFGTVAKLSIYPNPTNGAINLSGLAKGDVIRITDLLGRTIKTQEYLGDNVMNLSLDNAISGIYLLSVSRNGQITSTNRIVKN